MSAARFGQDGRNTMNNGPFGAGSQF